MERWPASINTKKKTRGYYNCEIKEYLARNYKKPKTKSGLQKK